jgi:hypothetical protein
MHGRDRSDEDKATLGDVINASFAADVAREDREWDDLPPSAKKAGDMFIRRDGLFLPKGVSIEKATKAQIRRARIAYARDYRRQ